MSPNPQERGHEGDGKSMVGERTHTSRAISPPLLYHCHVLSGRREDVATSLRVSAVVIGSKPFLSSSLLQALPQYPIPSQIPQCDARVVLTAHFGDLR